LPPVVGDPADRTNETMKIGIPLETSPGETRVASIPEVVKKLVGKGFDVLVESGAGARAGYPDADYEEAGAR
jgi:H+-translocating NAD(P) transhydrogenase subunit alpha